MHRFSLKFALRPAAFSACAAAIVCLSGCAGISGTAVPSSLTTSIPKGSLHGGQQPIQGARVYVYAAATPTTGGSYGSASTSLIQPGVGTTLDSNGHYYVTTDSSGSFSYAGTVMCPTPTSQIYILAISGNTTGHVAEALNNPAVALSAALGNCVDINSTTFTSINEVTTAAMAFALNPFMMDATHIGAPSTNTAGLINAFATVPNLVDNTTGTALATTPGGAGVAPQQTLNTLANIIAPCINSGSNTSAACSSLFSHTSNTAGTPLDTIGALLNIAQFPAAQSANLYSDALATAPFQPALTTQPNDFSLAIAYSAPGGTSVVAPGAVVIDGSGNLWMASNRSNLVADAPDALVEFSPTGAFIAAYTGSANPATQVFHQIQGLAIDATSHYIYTTNLATDTKQDEVIQFNIQTGTVGWTTTNPTTGGTPGGDFGTQSIAGVALDNNGNVWVTSSFFPTQTQPVYPASQPSSNVIELNPADGSELAVFYYTGAPGATGIQIPSGVATDNTGSIWVVGSGSNNIGKFSSAVAPAAGAFVTSYAPSGLSEPTAVAIDSNNNIWSVDQLQPALSQIKGFNGANASGSPYTNLALYQAAITAVDGANQILIPSCRTGCYPTSGLNAPDGLIRINQAGATDTGAAPGPSAAVEGQLTGGASPTYAFDGAGGIATDAAGNAWVTNSVSGKLTQVIGFAAPTRQPIAAASSAAALGTLP
jgi:hypothetical protein